MSYRTSVLHAPTLTRSTLYVDHYRQQIEGNAPGLVPMLKELISVSQRRFFISYGLTENNHIILETSLTAADKRLPGDPNHPLAIVIGPKEIFLTPLLSMEDLAAAAHNGTDLRKEFSTRVFHEPYGLNQLRQHLASLCRVQGMISQNEEKYIHETRWNQPLAEFVATRNALCPHLRSDIALTSGGRAVWGAAAKLVL